MNRPLWLWMKAIRESCLNCAFCYTKRNSATEVLSLDLLPAYLAIIRATLLGILTHGFGPMPLPAPPELPPRCLTALFPSAVHVPPPWPRFYREAELTRVRHEH
jgi:hypothetical protein